MERVEEGGRRGGGGWGMLIRPVTWISLINELINAVFSSELFLDIPFKCHLPQLNSLYINGRQPHYLLYSSITPPEDALQQQVQKVVTKNPCPDEAIYFQAILQVKTSANLGMATLINLGAGIDLQG